MNKLIRINVLTLILLVYALWTTSCEEIKNTEQGWTEWKNDSDCSRTCGGGVKYLSRKCLLTGSQCTGSDRKVASCNIQDCPPGSKDFRAVQCDKLHSNLMTDGASLELRYLESDPCTLYCRPQGSIPYYKSNVTDGTRCFPDSLDVCINGTCQVVGCDRQIGSKLRFDSCMKCGGTGNECRSQSGQIKTVDLETGYNDVLVLPAGSTSIRVDEGINQDYLAIKDRHGLYHLNGDFIISEDVEKWISGAYFRYQTLPDKRRVLTASGPLKYPIHVQILRQPGAGSVFSYSYSVPKDTPDIFTPAASGSRSSTDRPQLVKTTARGRPNSKNLNLLKWIVSDWSECKACQDKISTRKVVCLKSSTSTDVSILSDECDLGTRPSTQRPCPTFSPTSCSKQPQWVASEWSKCSSSCGPGYQYRKIYCVENQSNESLIILPNDQCEPERRMEAEKTCEGLCSAIWMTGEYGKCSVSCGEGIRYRPVLCLSNKEVSETECGIESRPKDSEACIVTDCQKSDSENCKSSEFGCCPDGVQAALGPEGAGCLPPGDPIPPGLCVETEFGCCPDGVTSAIGPLLEGCESVPTPTDSSEDDMNITSSASSTLKWELSSKEVLDSPDVLSTIESHHYDDNESGEDDPDHSGTWSPGDMDDVRGTWSPSAWNDTDDTWSVVNDTNGAWNFGGVDEINGTWNSDVMDEIEGTWSPGGMESPEDTWGPGGMDNMTTGELDNTTELIGEMASTNQTLSLLPEEDKENCTHSEHGCCSDGLTKALGSQQLGCAPDIPIHESDTVDCENTIFGCCEDGITAATGERQEGCPEYSPHTRPSTTSPLPLSIPRLEIQSTTPGVISTPNTLTTKGMITTLSQPVTPSRTCVDSQYGCCLDGFTTARGVNFTGCHDDDSRFIQSCHDSGFGCCSDGVTKASGPHDLGCPSTSGGECSLARDTGPCSNYSVRWFFDTALGDCSRFWYGGCEGNGNRFTSHEECKQSCVSPSGIKRCFLPVSTGRCRASMMKFYYNPAEQKCKEFTYGGCHGNDNKFESIEECDQECGSKLSTDVCSQPYMPGPCRGSHERWFYDGSVKQCRLFRYGGCLGNDNRFISRETCEQRCVAKTTTQDAESGPMCMYLYVLVCSLEPDTGVCLGGFTYWYYNKAASKCQKFEYGGCDGNENRFATEELCMKRCGTPAGKTKDLCTQPVDSGSCKAHFERWYYDGSDGTCKHFVYGGCEGNENRFNTEQQCRKACGAQQHIDVCSLPSESGPCDKYIVQWFYDKAEGQCRRFWFGGCEGNENRFSSNEECEKRCSANPTTATTTTTTTTTTTVAPTVIQSSHADSYELCSQPKDSGPCQRPMLRWFYNQDIGKCEKFAYGGCEGNRNRFLTEQHCLDRCGGFTRTPRPTPSHRTSHVDRTSKTRPTVFIESDISRCKLERDVGPCSADQRRWFFDLSSGRCSHFIFGGCGGNGNNFYSREECVQICEQPMTGQNSVLAPPTEAGAVCDLPRDRGSCYGEVLRYYYDAEVAECRPFIYGGCNGNGNSFLTPGDCYSACGRTNKADNSGTDVQVQRVYAPLDCFEPVSGGPCFDYEIRYHYKQEASDCLAFYYGGCEGNTNNFRSYDDCIALCTKASASRHCAALECGLSCPYGYVKGQDGCHQCQCYSPCEAHSCPSHMECFVEEVQCSTYPCPEPRPSCRLRERPGVCPTEADSYADVIIRSRRCSRECGVDSDCGGSAKCCPAQSCGMICMQPHFPPAAEKPGYCPTALARLVRRAKRCSRECDSDVDCEGTGKCCPAGSCGTICIQPAQAEEQPNYGQYLVPQMKALHGESITLPTCKTRSRVQDEVTWFKDNVELDSNSTEEGYEITERGLELSNVTSQHGALYTCRHSHQLQSYSFSVDMPAKFTSPGQSYREYLVGQMVRISCDREGEPLPTVTWLKNGQPFRQTYEQVLHGDDIIMRRAEVKDSAAFDCQISNKYSRQTKRFHIKIVENFTATLTTNSTGNDSFVVGDDAELLCDVEGPRGVGSSLEWTLNGHPIALSGVLWDERYQVDETRERLTIKDVIREDEGEFGCEVISSMEDGTKLTASSYLNVTITQAAVPDNCLDKPWYANCKLIIEARLCRHPYFSVFCCNSCYAAGHLP